MLKSNTFSRKTKGGKIKKEVREIYLRDDIYGGAAACKTCDTSTSNAPLDAASPLVVLDSNVILQQIDLLENPSMDNAVLLSVVLNEVKNKNMAVYNRIRALSTNPLHKFYVFNICSLRADVERLAFSAIWEMSPDAEIISTRFTKSNIKSCAALSYVEAEARMDDRRHPTSTREMLEPLLCTAAAVGLDLDVASSRHWLTPLTVLVDSDMATKCMTQAVYFCSGDLSPPECHHYGFAAPLYTHFTSPIRRYAGIDKLPSVFQDRAQLTSIADNLNYRHRNAQMASRASVELHTLIYFRNRYMPWASPI
ncbi:Ribonuclease II family protein isoform 2 [Hibiscus syriacus]|uniref:Ribonuclease II family protein isoform 2 n=1 Tax=Hibiscus syriacus TaxID=106335 RepID=A0A6A2WTS4_HIBSY|nr:Ribonuclease II family protein isoform 2 [Hibiscus syriacus]